MESNIEVIYLRFQGNEIDANKLCKCFPTCIEGQQSHHNLNCKKHMLQLPASKKFEVPEILHNHTTICSI